MRASCAPGERAWDEILRALVFDAYSKRGTDEFAAACLAIVDEHARWPLTRYAVELRWARAEQARMRSRRAAVLAALRASYPRAAA